MIMIVVMMTMMMTIMRIKTICEVINKTRIKVTVLMIMQIELVTVLKYRTLQFGALITSFIELENKELHLCSGLLIMLQILYLSMASKKIPPPPVLPSEILIVPPFSLQKLLTPPPPPKKNPLSSLRYKSINLLTLIREMGLPRSSEPEAHV